MKKYMIVLALLGILMSDGWPFIGDDTPAESVDVCAKFASDDVE